MTRVPLPILTLLALGLIISLLMVLPGCAVIQGGVSAAGGYMTHKEFDEHDGRMDALETRVRAMERWAK